MGKYENLHENRTHGHVESNQMISNKLAGIDKTLNNSFPKIQPILQRNYESENQSFDRLSLHYHEKENEFEIIHLDKRKRVKPEELLIYKVTPLGTLARTNPPLLKDLITERQDDQFLQSMFCECGAGINPEREKACLDCGKVINDDNSDSDEEFEYLTGETNQSEFLLQPIPKERAFVVEIISIGEESNTATLNTSKISLLPASPSRKVRKVSESHSSVRV